MSASKAQQGLIGVRALAVGTAALKMLTKSKEIRVRMLSIRFGLIKGNNDMAFFWLRNMVESLELY